MRRIVLIIALIVINNNYSKSQNTFDPLPVSPNISFSTTSVYDPKFYNNHFLRGWNWGSVGRKLDDALFINSYHHMPEEFTHKFIIVR